MVVGNYEVPRRETNASGSSLDDWLFPDEMSTPFPCQCPRRRKPLFHYKFFPFILFWLSGANIRFRFLNLVPKPLQKIGK